MSGITIGPGKYGQTSLELATASRTVSPDTEMLFSFEGDSLRDEAGRFQVVSSNVRLILGRWYFLEVRPLFSRSIQ